MCSNVLVVTDLVLIDSGVEGVDDVILILEDVGDINCSPPPPFAKENLLLEDDEGGGLVGDDIN